MGKNFAISCGKFINLKLKSNFYLVFKEKS